MTGNKGILVISLDFELYWGVRDRRPLEGYREHLLGVRQVIPSLLRCFAEHDIHATWATVGFLFFRTRDELVAALPVRRPAYTDPAFSPYDHIARIGPDEDHDPFHYGGSLVSLIRVCRHQEIATHTFSHYYCLEEGQEVDTFRADLEAALETGRRHGLHIDSLVFPRYQLNPEYLEVCRELGIRAYRGTESSRIYRPTPRKRATSLWKRGLRLLDAYFNVFSHNCYPPAELADGRPFNIPASRFLRPCPERFGLLEPLRLRRILNDLSHAAEHGLVYHLWWHPHNFGKQPEKNLQFLGRILQHYASLRDVGRMESLNMRELAGRLEQLTCEQAGGLPPRRDKAVNGYPLPSPQQDAPGPHSRPSPVPSPQREGS